jgi:hypothetical protein
MAHSIWQGSSSFASGQTPYGFYDADSEFSGSGNHSVDRFADWAGRRLGYPIVDIDLFMHVLRKQLQNIHPKLINLI